MYGGRRSPQMELHLCSTLRARSRVLAHRQPECDALELTAGNFPFFDDQEEMRYIRREDDAPNLAITRSQGPDFYAQESFLPRLLQTGLRYVIAFYPRSEVKRQAASL